MMVAVMPVMVVVAMAMAAAMPASMAVAVIAAFLEREFVTHADIKFAHKSPWVCAVLNDRKENIIM
jgi:hypothetical protein